MRRERSHESREAREQPKAQIRLEFIRHDQKAPTPDGVPDEAVPLTPEGRKHTIEFGRNRNPNPRMGFAYGSPRVRAQETVLRNLFAHEDWLREDMTPEEIIGEIKSRLPYGQKLYITEKLNFRTGVHPVFAETYSDHYFKRKDTVPFIYYESDRLVRDLGDQEDFSFTRLAGNVAELIKRYVNMLPRWKEILEKNPDKYDGNEMQRFLGSHSTVGESFLLKVIEKTEGLEAAKKFIDDLPDKNGIGFSDGFSVAITTNGARPSILITFHEKKWNVGPELIDEIIRERQAFDREVADKGR